MRRDRGVGLSLCSRKRAFCLLSTVTTDTMYEYHVSVDVRELCALLCQVTAIVPIIAVKKPHIEISSHILFQWPSGGAGRSALVNGNLEIDWRQSIGQRRDQVLGPLTART